MQELVIDEWKAGDSLSVYTQIIDPVLPLPSMVAPVLLFGLYYGLDSSIYTEHYSKVSSVLYERGNSVNTHVSKELVIKTGTKLKTSFHGSGEIVGFERTDENWPRAHLGYVLRDSEVLTKLASQWIGTAGHYLGQFEISPSPSIRSVVIPGLFETTEVPVFNIWVTPAGGPIPEERKVISATTRILKTGKKLEIYVTLGFVATDYRPSDARLIAYVATNDPAKS